MICEVFIHNARLSSNFNMQRNSLPCRCIKVGVPRVTPGISDRVKGTADTDTDNIRPCESALRIGWATSARETIGRGLKDRRGYSLGYTMGLGNVGLVPAPECFLKILDDLIKLILRETPCDHVN
jgi:hypothetical protein